MKHTLMVALALAMAAISGSVPLACSSVSTASIRVNLKHIISHLSPWMYGSCIEDVNHEIYGGLYAQRIFGESFEEPPVAHIPGWTAYGGDWKIAAGGLEVSPNAGAKLVRNMGNMTNGTVSCEIRFPNATGDNAGLILRVSDPRTGADSWIGYEVSLSVSNQSLILGSHRNNWQPLRQVPIHLLPNIWYRLRVDLQGSLLRIYVNNGTVAALTYDDGKGAIPSGTVGLRTWNSQVEFRNLRIRSDGHTTLDSLSSKGRDQQPEEVSGMWDPVVTGSAKAAFIWDTSNPYNSAHSQQIVFESGSGMVGVANRGLNRWGIALHRGKTMEGHLYVRGDSGDTAVTVALQSADGKRTYAQQKLSAAGAEWTRRDFRLDPNSTNPNARFEVWLSHPGKVNIDQVYLSDTGKALFHGGPFRADIGRMLVNEDLTFMRYGGTMVNAPNYLWKNMTGLRDKRPQYDGSWYPYSTNGFAIPEFLQFCEDAHIQPTFAINIEEPPAEAADMVKYLTDPETSKWGAKRAADGHPAPYDVQYIEIGNEEAINGSGAWYKRYLACFERLYSAMHTANPHIKFIVAAWWAPNDPWCKTIAKALNGKASLWDVHVNADNLKDANTIDAILTQMQQLFLQWIPGSNMKACILEENGGLHDLQRALSHAHILNVVMRHGDFVRIDCPANCLQPYHENDNGWDQGQVFFTPDEVWGMPPYYAQQMASLNREPLCVDCQTTSPDNALDVTATRSTDGKTLVLQVVNSADTAQTASVNLADFVPRKQVAIWTLAGALTAVNTPKHPREVVWHKTEVEQGAPGMQYTFLAHSYTILRLQRR